MEIRIHSLGKIGFQDYVKKEGDDRFWRWSQRGEAL